jgi:DNA-binding LytR/AlgR family response regulator
LNTDEILFLKADNNATDFFMRDGSTISAFKTLKVFEGLLPDNFLRIHKSYIINSRHVSRINFGKLVCTVERDIHKIPFTKTYLDNVEIMNNALSKSSFLFLN